MTFPLPRALPSKAFPFPRADQEMYPIPRASAPKSFPFPRVVRTVFPKPRPNPIGATNST
jgi:hypothetical protein